MAPAVTTTRSVSAVFFTGVGLGAGETATCALAIPPLMTEASKIRNIFFKRNSPKLKVEVHEQTRGAHNG